jgi:hypothetical protein
LKIKKYWKKIKKKHISENSIPEYLENYWRLVEKNQIYKIEKFDSVFLTDEGPIGKEKSIWEGKFKIRCLRTQL